MAYLLAIESATKVCSVAIFENNKLLALKEQDGVYSHAENLAVFVDQLLTELQIESKDLTAIAISKGPGSYTGLRIGTSFAKGLCYALNIPLISIDTLESMAWGLIQKKDESDLLVCPMIDARRMEVYAAIYNSNLDVVRAVSADIIESASYGDFLEKGKVYFVGDGAEKCEDVIVHTNAVFVKDEFPSAKKMGELANKKYRNNDFEDVAYFEPYYHKEFIAIKSKKLV